jgi:UDP-N-acetylglucosamine 2-epimerase (non-hydrolysing)
MSTSTGARLKVMLAAGARPNFVKIAPLLAEMEKHRQEVEPFLVHTGQHYDDVMSEQFFRDLEIPKPDVNLAVGPGSHAQQTARIMERFEPVVSAQKPDVVVVVGDVNSTVACALVAAKLGVAVAHVEAGLRSHDRRMPEELNRIVTDHLSDLAFASEQSGVENLLREGIRPESIHLVGNVMVDALLVHAPRARRSDVLRRLALNGVRYGVVTLHRPENVDAEGTLRGIVQALVGLSADLALVFPLHPRTKERLEQFGLRDRLERQNGIHLLEAQGYLDFLRLTSGAQLILTDSGGLQEEACVLRVPCLTLRPTTERPATVEAGWNRLVGTDPDVILREARAALATRVPARGGRRGTEVPLWDGKASERIVAILTREMHTEGART